MDIINSKSNSKYKYVKSLLNLKYRNKEQKYLAEGLRNISLALKHKSEIECVFVSNYFYKNKKNNLNDLFKNYKFYILEDELFKNISSTENSQGITAIVKMNKKSIYFLDNEKHKKIVILDRIQDPGNMGTIIRTADALGYDLLVVLKGCVDIYNPKVVRSAMGSLFYMDIIETEDDILLEALKKNKIEIVSTSLKTENYFDKINYSKKVAIILGNEANGVSDFWVKNSDKIVKIPIKGNAESLNVSISSGILMYHINN